MKKHIKFNDFNWDSIVRIEYKNPDKDKNTFFNVTRQNIITDKYGVNFEVRYFECGQSGYTTLEKHEHIHIVLTARGNGKIIIGNQIFNAQPFDIFVIYNWMPHQLINNGDEPFGFFCSVNAIRDTYQLLKKEEIMELKKNQEIEKYLQIPAGYFKA